MTDQALTPTPSARAGGARFAAQALRAYQARVSIIDRTDVSTLSDAMIDDALAYVQPSAETKVLAEAAKLACRRLVRIFKAPHVAATPRRHLIERARQRAQCRLTELQIALRDAPDSWVVAHMRKEAG